ncbi:hypothetical protein AGMMS49990_08240 [Endomicrobiia bacterium]|nr:hypothetical protein AGMMS49990_08240 [Endomicrobiia bacterium]
MLQYPIRRLLDRKFTAIIQNTISLGSEGVYGVARNRRKDNETKNKGSVKCDCVIWFDVKLVR